MKGLAEVSASIETKLSSNGFNIENKGEIKDGIKLNLKKEGSSCGLLRLYKSKKGITIDPSQLLTKNDRVKVYEILSQIPEINSQFPGSKSLPATYYLRTKNAIKRIEDFLTRVHPQLIKYEKPGDRQIYNLNISGTKFMQFESGILVVQGKPTKLSDELLDQLGEETFLLAQEEMEELVKPHISKETFEKFRSELGGRQINLKKYNISKDLYDFLNPNDYIELTNGIILLEFSKRHKIPLKNFIVLVRSFAIMFEGFLIKLFLELGHIDRVQYVLEGSHQWIGRILSRAKDQASLFEKHHGQYFKQRYAYIPAKLDVLWKECRNKYLHSDEYGYEVLSSIEGAEAKIYELLETMGKTYEILGDLAVNRNSKCIGTDEVGKGDYFGPLVVAGVLITGKEQMAKLQSIGVRDSKNLTDNAVRELATQIREIVRCEEIIISPSSYNELYSDFKNLNKLLGWGHAKVIENLLQHSDCNYAISDQFGDESYIKDALKVKGRKILLEQRPKAEDHSAVAAASIVARDAFLNYHQKMCTQLGIDLPKGSSDPSVKQCAEAIVKKHGFDSLGNYVKLHFRTTSTLDTAYLEKSPKNNLPDINTTQS